MSGAYDTEEECEKYGIDIAWQKVLNSGQKFCQSWVTCEEDWPVIYVPEVTKEKACSCVQIIGKWYGYCSTAWKGHCECDVQIAARQ